MAKTRLYLIIVVFLASFLAYMSNGRTILPSDDTTPARYLPVSILTEFNLDLDEFPQLRSVMSVKKIRGHYFSFFPVTAALLATPVYATARIFGASFDAGTLLELEKISASLITALSAVFILLSLMELASVKNAVLLTFVYAFGTCSWSVSSQALWQHGASQLFSSMAIYFLLRGIKDDSCAGYAGLFAGLCVCARPTNMLIAAILSVYVFHKHRRRLPVFLLLQAIPLSFLAFYNFSVFRNMLGGYSLAISAKNFASPFLGALAGILVSPSRGLFIYTPVLIFSFIGIMLALRRGMDIIFIYFGLIVAANTILLSKYITWFGGGCFGPRLFNDTLPFLVVLLVPALRRTGRSFLLKAAFTLLLIYSVAVQMLGAYVDDNMWNDYPNINYNPQRLWSWKDSQLVYIIKRCEPLSRYLIRDRAYYSSGGTIDFTNEETFKYFGYGWSLPADCGTWAVGNKSLLFLHLLRQPPEYKTLNLECSSFAGQKMKIYVNDKPLGEMTFDKPLWEWGTREMDIPGNYLTGGIERIKFVCSANWMASDTDLRRISVIFKSMTFR